MNAVLVQGDAVGATLYYGKGAGAEPTASAVIADLVDITRLATADPEHRVPHLAFQPNAMADTPILPMSEVTTSYYLRMRVADKPGVLADVTRILADSAISIDAMLQKEPAEGETQTDIIMLTHQTQEKNVDCGDCEDRGPAHRGWQGGADPVGGVDVNVALAGRKRCSYNDDRSVAIQSIQSMQYVSTRGQAAPSPFPRSCLAAWRQTAVCICRLNIRRLAARNSMHGASCRMPTWHWKC